ncbi:hypothetical protein [Bradyrhizobium sp. Tv2a-2]|uniref:T4SS efffector SepA family protein n=1 Tax=Bradyrhizobium sp. Tv2a-2 TaxID=113395 RepID=UPI0012EB8D82|nr:hypothetical protein [Bradyrhizobium sp. Tv2a-2]
MPMVAISNSNFSRLQSHATPLVDDLDSVLAKILDVYEKTTGARPAPASVGEDEDLSVKTYPVENPPLLTYTSLSNILIDGKAFDKKYWNPVLFEVIRQATVKMGFDALKPHLDVNYKDNEVTGFGEFIKEAGITVQGRDANLCYRSIMKVAKAAKISVTIDFYWQETPKAAHPGRAGRFVYDGK